MGAKENNNWVFLNVQLTKNLEKLQYSRAKAVTVVVAVV